LLSLDLLQKVTLLDGAKRRRKKETHNPSRNSSSPISEGRIGESFFLLLIRSVDDLAFN